MIPPDLGGTEEVPSEGLARSLGKQERQHGSGLIKKRLFHS